MPALAQRVHALLESSTAQRIVCDVEALVEPDVATVDALARLRLAARLRGRDVVLLHASDDLQRLIALVGLDDALPPCEALVVQVEGQVEEGEDRRGIEEEDDPRDPSVA